jgi:hypothetical protein
MNSLISLTEDEFDAQFDYVTAADGSFYHETEPFTPLLETADREHRLWTAVDDDEGNPCLVSGRQYVNRFAFVISQRPYDPGQEYHVKLGD